ncbi:hypothetical protein [Vulcaniibacterium tengchongense]|uniref:Secreted protein n=1 Tax=Vulcaniibacterium tengchongense TaxID=1273429 RepID=A0A3N4VJ76_9GAMM|nr:hypothetical protein [Vulcaniibacterium tengchongense]RPE77097.1 hypothetical protein EDC50_2354 [Vulcaniibacterium tengchongense]
MKSTTRLLLIACLSLPLLAACQKEEAKPAEVVEAPLTAPTTTDSAAWDKYLTEVVKRNIEGATNVYLYTLPDPAGPDFQGEYDRQLEKAKTDVSRGGVEGTLLAFGSQNSAKSADLAVAAFAGAQAGSMNGVRVLFIGAPADSERVKAAVAPSGAKFEFFEVK